MFESESANINTKLKDWASNRWNWLDLSAIMIFYISLSLRYTRYEEQSHILYAIDVAMFILRLLNMVFIHHKMGPYVVMIGRMVSSETVKLGFHRFLVALIFRFNF